MKQRPGGEAGTLEENRTLVACCASELSDGGDRT